MNGKQYTILAIDQSTTSVGYAHLRGWINNKPDISYGDFTDDNLLLNIRLFNIYESIKKLVSNLNNDYLLKIVIEDYSYGSVFNREKMGESVGIIKSAVFQVTNIREFDKVSISNWKKYIYPDWYGWNKKNWVKSQRKTKFKMSQPNKKAIQHKLIQDYDLIIKNNNAADAVGIALYYNFIFYQNTNWHFKDNKYGKI